MKSVRYIDGCFYTPALEECVFTPLNLAEKLVFEYSVSALEDIKRRPLTVDELYRLAEYTQDVGGI